jgi:hypothetical protein
VFEVITPSIGRTTNVSVGCGDIVSEGQVVAHMSHPRAVNPRALLRDVSPKPVARRGTTEPQPVADIVSSPEDDVRTADVRCAQRIHNPVSLPSADQDPATNFDRGGL